MEMIVIDGEELEYLKLFEFIREDQRNSLIIMISSII